MDLLTQLAENGILALLLAIAIAGNVYQYKQKEKDGEKYLQKILDIQSERIAEAKSREESALDVIREVKSTLDKTFSLVASPPGKRRS